MAVKTLTRIKQDIEFTANLTGIIDSMKGIAAAQYHVMEKKLTPLETYAKATSELFQLYDFRNSYHPFIRAQNEKTLICMVTTDAGFLGGLNVKVIQEGMKYAEGQSYFMVLGEKGVSFLREMKLPHTTYAGIAEDDARYELLEKVVQDMMHGVLEQGYGRAILVYPNAVSFTLQRIEAINLIPCPLFFKDRPDTVLPEEIQAKDVILESDPDGIIEYLTKLYLKKRLIELFESSKLAEYGARTMHLEDSYQTLMKQDKKIKHDYFKARRARIDQSLRESFTAQMISKDDQ